jgi:hypothetical protein
VSARLTGLAANTTYHFRISATTAATITGRDGTFTTLLNSASGTSNSPGTPASANDGQLSATTSNGEGTVTVGQYGSNPAGRPTFVSNGAYVDVHVSPGNTFTSLEFTDCELSGGKKLFWWDPQARGGKGEWHPASAQTAPSGEPPCITVTIDETTSPSLAQLTGTVFGVALPPGPAPTIKKLSPKKGPAAGGTAVTISGKNFGFVYEVKFGSAEAKSFTVNSPTSMTAVAPPGTKKTTVNVTVTGPGGTSEITRKARFKYAH